MPPAADLSIAANQASPKLMPLYQADTLAAAFTAFATTATALFPTDQNQAGNVPMASWCAQMAAFAPSILDFNQVVSGMGIGHGSITTYQQAVDLVFRICSLGYYLNSLATPLITNAQAAALLAAFNANFP